MTKAKKKAKGGRMKDRPGAKKAVVAAPKAAPPQGKAGSCALCARVVHMGGRMRCVKDGALVEARPDGKCFVTRGAAEGAAEGVRAGDV